MIKNSGMHKRTFEDLQSRQTLHQSDYSYVPKLFDTVIYQRDSSSNIADFDKNISTIRKKYGNNYNDYLNLTHEFLNRINL